MSTIEELHEQTTRFLTSSVEEWDRLGAAASPGGSGVARVFSVFNPKQLEHALALARGFMETVNAHPGNDGLERVLAQVERLRATENLDLLKYALLVFITHHPVGRRLPIPPFDQRDPEKAVPSRKGVVLGLEILGALGPEADLDYFREDTAVNEHHGKWHVVYPAGGHPDPGNPSRVVTKDREGELFWYMHQQMLARYDTERKAFGLAPVEPLADYRAPIHEGYDANLLGYSNRAPDSTLTDLREGDGSAIYLVADHERRRDRLNADARNGFLRRDGAQVPINASLLANTMEANVDSVEGGNRWGDPTTHYGNFHNFGHVLIASAAGPNGTIPATAGVMTDTATAVRDPVFFRWHRHIDDLFVGWQETLPENDFAAGAPPVRLRKGSNAHLGESPDILLALRKDVPGAAAANFDGQAYAEAHLGGEHWDVPPDSLPTLTGELPTFMRQETIALPDGRRVRKPYLDHEDFYYFFRLENLSDREQKVTVRVFLTVKEWADDRRRWIEMDKFPATVAPHAKAVVFRPDRRSSVVRKPAIHPSEPRPPQPPGAVGKDYCDCGWPYHLLLPRGTEAGMDFRLLVALSDHQADLAGGEKQCGSLSFCGARDALYPDRQAMGYPFDRPFRQRTITQVVASQQNMAARDLKIRFLGPRA